MLSPRGWQAEALPVVAAELRRGEPVLVSACTGAGKSIFLALLLRDLLSTRKPGTGPIVVMVPTMALVDQLAATLSEHLPVRVGRWYGPRKELADVVVCCLPSLPTLLEHLEALSMRVSLAVMDECHRAETAAELIERMRPRLRMGLTATPYRSQTGLSLWPAITYRYTMAQAIAAGDLVPPRVIYWTGDADAGVNEATLAMIQAHGEGPGVVSATDIADAEWYAGWLSEQGVAAEAIHSQCSGEQRRRMLARLRDGELRCLVHVRVLSEGVDLPWLRWLALRASHGRNRVGLVQEVGRVLRTHEAKSVGVVLDPLQLTHPSQVGIEHAPDLVSMADEPEEEGESLVEREQREQEDLQRAEEQVRAMDEASAWLEAARWTIEPDAWPREGPPTPGQLQRLADARGRRWLAADLRERMAPVWESPELLTRGAASDAIAILTLAARRAADHYARTRSWRHAPRLGVDDLTAQEEAG